MIELNNLSEKELQELANKIKQQQDAIAQEKLNKVRETVKEKMRTLRENSELILSLIDHSKKSCSDDNPFNSYVHDNGHPECTKCKLIDMFQNEWEDGFWDVNIEISVHEVK